MMPPCQDTDSEGSSERTDSDGSDVPGLCLDSCGCLTFSCAPRSVSWGSRICKGSSSDGRDEEMFPSYENIGYQDSWLMWFFRTIFSSVIKRSSRMYVPQVHRFLRVGVLCFVFAPL